MKPKIDMDELIVRKLQGRATEAESRTLTDWLAASQTNRSCYRQVQTVWEVAQTVSLPSRAAPRPRAVELLSHQGTEKAFGSRGEGFLRIT